MAAPAKKGMLGVLGGIAAFVAALALFITNVETLRTAWCSNVRTFCSSPPPAWVKSDVVYVFSGGTTDNKSDVCKAHQAPVCVRPSGPDKQIQPDTAHFDATERSGAVYLDGGPANSDPIGTHNIGWFLQPDKASPNEVCATVFARTSACETKVDIRGQLIAREIAKR